MWMILVEAILFVTMYYFMCMDGDIKNTRIKEVMRHVNVLSIMIIAVGMCCFVNFQLPIVCEVLPDSIVQQYSSMIEQAGYGEELIPTIICLILAPIAEEFMFRGVIFYCLIRILETRLMKRRAFWVANMIQAVLFGLFHMNLIQGGYAFLVGLVLGFLVYRYQSILPALMAHAINNIISACMWHRVMEALPQGNGIYVIGVIFSLCAVVVGTILCISNTNKKSRKI